MGERAFTAVDPDGTRRAIQGIEVAYALEGEVWHQLLFAVPYGAARMVVRAQATEPRCAELFTATQRVAATLGPIG